MTAINIDLGDDGRRAIIKPASYLASAFYDFKAACDRGGASYDGTLRTQTASLDSVPGIVELLREAGFEPRLSASVVSGLRSRQSELEVRVSNARARLSVLADAFAKRNLALMNFQVEGTTWLATRTSALLGDEQGLGKTIQVLAALEPGVPMLCVAPANVVENWPLESVKWRPEFSVVVLNKKSFRWPAKGEIVVVSHDALPAGIEQERTSQMQPRVFRQDASIGTPLPGTVIVIDEIQKGANHRTKRYASFSAAVEEVHAVGGTSWGLSGTPLRNHPGELWNVLSILKIAREAFGSRKRFDELHDVSFGTYGGREFGTAIRSDAVAEGLRRVMLRREKKDQIDLPPVIYQKLTVSIDQATMRLCDEVAKKIGLSDDALERAIEDAIESKHGASFTELSRARAALASAKIPAMLEFVETAEENEEPLIVFSYHRAPIDALAKRPGWARISGDETPIQRRDVVAQFQAGKLKGVALTIGAGAEGITLTRGRVMLFVDLAWTPASNNQARDRFNRIGQLADRLTVYNLVAKHRVDERVSEILNAKSFITNETVNAATVVSIDVSNTALRIERVLNDASNVITSDDELANREIDGVQIAPVTPSEALAADWLRSGVYGSKLNQAEQGYATMLGARLTKGLGLTTTQWTAASVLHARSAS